MHEASNNLNKFVQLIEVRVLLGRFNLKLLELFLSGSLSNGGIASFALLLLDGG